MALAVRGVDTYLDTATERDFTGVFQLGTRVETLLAFTTDTSAVRSAVRRIRGLRTKLGISTAAAGGTRPQASGAKLETFQFSMTFQRFIDGVLVDERTFSTYREWLNATDEHALTTRLDRATTQLDQQADAHRLAGLLALVDTLGDIPGRKTVVYFSEGDGLATETAQRYRESIIASANLHNVSVYTVDSAGLRARSTTEAMAAQLAEQSQYAAGLERDAARPWTTDLETNEQLLQGDATTSLAILAQRTGGFMIANTNDFNRGLRAIETDRHADHLLRYTPANTTFKGEYPSNRRQPARAGCLGASTQRISCGGGVRARSSAQQ